MFEKHNKIGNNRTILIWRDGSLGDQLVTLPVLNEIRRRWPDTKLRLIHQVHQNEKAVPPKSIFGTQYYEDFISIDLSQRGGVFSFFQALRAHKDTDFIYLQRRMSTYQVVRDLIFLKLAGLRHIYGLSLKSTDIFHQPRQDSDQTIFECEAYRLYRNIFRPESSNQRYLDYTLTLGDKEKPLATSYMPRDDFFVFSIGTKFQENEWGDEKWARLIRMVTETYKLKCIAVGGASDRERSDAILNATGGPTVNYCGELSIRETSHLLSRAVLFIGHDSGPLHLANASGTRSLGVFGGRNQPGIWFPDSTLCRIVYPGYGHLASDVGFDDVAAEIPALLDSNEFIRRSL